VSFLSLYRKWRSQTFDEIVGQVHVTQTLKNAVTNNRISHAYLFCGPRGTGKTSTARVLAKALNCEKGPSAEPCNQCSICQHISSGSALDVIEIDAASNRGINEIRELREKVKYAPTNCKYKVYIIDEVHMLTKEAFNALLKTLEEPPSHVIFVLATTESHKLLPTILSRCQRFDFKRISVDDTVSHLKTVAKKERLSIDEQALNLISAASEGSLRDALSLLDQLISYSGKNIKVEDVVTVVGSVSEDVFLKLTTCIINQDPGQALNITRKLIEEGKDINQLIKSFIQYFRDLIVIKLCPSHKGLIDRAESSMKYIVEQAKKISVGRLMNSIKILTDLKQQLTWDTQWHIQTEIAMLKICHRSLDSSPKAMHERIVELEAKMKNLPHLLKTDKVKIPKKEEIQIEPCDLIGFYKEKEDVTKTGDMEVSKETVKIEKVFTEPEPPVAVAPVQKIKSLPAEDRLQEPEIEPPPVTFEPPVPAEPEMIHTIEEDFSPLPLNEKEEKPDLPVEDEKVFEELLEEPEDKKGDEIIESKDTVTLEMISGEWENFLRKFKRENFPVYQLLIHAKLSKLREKVLNLSFTNSFYRDQMEDSSYKNIVQEAIESYFNKKLLIRAKLVEKKVHELSLFGDPLPETKKKKEKEKEEDRPSIEEVTELFGGDIIN